MKVLRFYFSKTTFNFEKRILSLYENQLTYDSRRIIAFDYDKG